MMYYQNKNVYQKKLSASMINAAFIQTMYAQVYISFSWKRPQPSEHSQSLLFPSPIHFVNKHIALPHITSRLCNTAS